MGETCDAFLTVKVNNGKYKYLPGTEVHCSICIPINHDLGVTLPATRTRCRPYRGRSENKTLKCVDSASTTGSDVTRFFIVMAPP